MNRPRPIAWHAAALNGEVVTQAHADYCAEHGHATHTVDGVDSGLCPRCGEVTTIAAPRLHPAAFIAFTIANDGDAFLDDLAIMAPPVDPPTYGPVDVTGWTEDEFEDLTAADELTRIIYEQDVAEWRERRQAAQRHTLRALIMLDTTGPVPTVVPW